MSLSGILARVNPYITRALFFGALFCLGSVVIAQEEPEQLTDYAEQFEQIVSRLDVIIQELDNVVIGLGLYLGYDLARGFFRG